MFHAHLEKLKIASEIQLTNELDDKWKESGYVNKKFHVKFFFFKLLVVGSERFTNQLYLEMDANREYKW